MFKVLDLTPAGTLEVSEDPARVAPPPPGVRRWVDLIEPDPDALALLRERFQFHPLAIADCGRFELRSKLEEYRDHLFVVLHTFTAPASDPTDLQIHEIHGFLGESFLVTVHDRPVPATEEVFTRAAADPSVLGRGATWPFYLAARAMIEAIFPVIEGLVDKVDPIEAEVLSHPDSTSSPREIFVLRSTLVTIKRVIRPLRDVVGTLTRRQEPPMDSRTALYFRDIHDGVLRSLETIEETEGLIANVVDAYRFALSKRSNDIMAKLTVFSAIFLPLGFITGFWGQNFAALPFGSHAAFLATLTSIVVVPAVLLVWFGKNGWLRRPR